MKREMGIVQMRLAGDSNRKIERNFGIDRKTESESTSISLTGATSSPGCHILSSSLLV